MQYSSQQRHFSPMAVAMTTTLVLAAFTLSGCGLLVGPGGDDLLVTQPAAKTGAASTTTPTAGESESPDGVSYSEATVLIGSGALLVDVSLAASFGLEHASGAVNHPLASLETAYGMWGGRAVVITADNEPRARSAVAFLKRQGVDNVQYLLGGNDGWSGTFAGTAARVATSPATIHVFFQGDTGKLIDATRDGKRGVIYASNMLPQLQPEMLQQLGALEDEFAGDVTVEFTDISANLNGSLSLMKNLGVTAFDIEGADVYAAPLWVLVDREGKTVDQVILPYRLMLPYLHSWCADQVL